MIVQYGKHQRLIIDKVAKLVLVPIYFALVAIMYTGYAAIYLNAPLFSLDTLSFMRLTVEILIAVVLIIRFRPFREHFISHGDAGIIFASATFLVANVFLEKYTAYLTGLEVAANGLITGVQTGINALHNDVGALLAT
jgi:hypothetical protein